MHHYFQGKPTKQAHKGIPEGNFEEEQGRKGFFGPVSHLLRKEPSTRWIEIDGPLKPRMFDMVPFFKDASQPLGFWQRLFFNQHVHVGVKTLSPNQGSAIAQRNADGDTIYFCHSGEGHVFTDYGALFFKKGHYVVMPKCLTHHISVKTNSTFFVIESKTSQYEEPDRGIAGRHAVYDINAIGKPDLKLQEQILSADKKSFLEIHVKYNEELTRFRYANCVFDVIAWKGDLFPYTLHVDDMMPLMSHRAHLPPSAHTTFVSREFVVCTFLPRPLEQDADALKVPFYHQNIDYDEILFYHEGDFFSRDNLHAGMLSYHPAGFAHGPHPKAMASVSQKTHTNEYAVMLDSRWPLQRDPILDEVEFKEYWKSWMKKS